MKDILYTFIIPHKNSLSLLQRCIDSIPQREDVEIIVVDDNSEKKPIINRKGVSVICLDSQNSKWAGHARNVGMSMAQGKWLLFADADDYYCDRLLETLDLYSNYDVDVIYFNFCRVDYNLSIEQNSIIMNYSGTPNELDLIKYKMNAPWNKMIKRQFVVKNNIKFEETINGNDMFFSYQIGYFADQICVSKTPIYMYQTFSSGMTNKKNNPDEYYLCRIRHWYQTREFYRFIKHDEWNSFLFFNFLRILWKKGVREFCKCMKVYIANYKKICSSQLLFVNYMRQKY